MCQKRRLHYTGEWLMGEVRTMIVKEYSAPPPLGIPIPKKSLFKFSVT